MNLHCPVRRSRDTTAPGQVVKVFPGQTVGHWKPQDDATFNLNHPRVSQRIFRHFTSLLVIYPLDPPCIWAVAVNGCNWGRRRQKSWHSRSACGCSPPIPGGSKMLGNWENRLVIPPLFVPAFQMPKNGNVLIQDMEDDVHHGGWRVSHGDQPPHPSFNLG